MLRVLGETDVTRDGEPEIITSHMQRALLAALALDREQVVPADRLADRIWGEDLPANPVASLQSHVSRLRRILPDDVRITTVGEGYRLDVGDDDLDVDVFEKAFQHASANESPDRVPVIESALRLWRGTPYTDLGDPEASAEAARLDEMRQSLIELRAASLIELGRPHEAIADMENLRVQHPFRERPVELLMRAYLEVGRKSDSLRVYRDLSKRLGDDLGIDPAPELRALEEAILREELIAERVAPTPTGSWRAPTIALPASPLLGRDAEVAELSALLRKHRIVTVIGPGGVGKTRVASHVAHSAADAFADGTVLIELAAVRDPAQITDVVASALDVRQRTGIEPLDRIIDHIGDHRLLVVLDSCDHLVEQAAHLVDALISGTPGVAVLATSREALNIDGERLWRLDPLAVDSTDPADAAIALFAERAAAVLPGFELDDSNRAAVAHVCRSLDGLPLAIELAAARLATLSLDEVVAGLDERFEVFNRGRRTADERHRSLRAVVGWSCRQLDADQLRIFGRLSVFAGRFTGRAATEVCGPADGGGAIGDVLADLVERSLLVEHREMGAPTRYGYLETIQAFAAEVLAEHGETDEFRGRHTAWAIALAELMQQRLAGPGEMDATRRLTDELPELRIAHRHLLDRGDADGSLRLIAALSYFALLRMQSEVYGWAIATADRFGAVDHPLTETVLAAASVGSWKTGANEASSAYARAAVEAAARRDEPGAGRDAAAALSDALLWEGDTAGSLAQMLDAVRLSREVDATFEAILHLGDAVLCAAYVGDIDQALELAAEARALMGENPAPSLESWIDYAEGEALSETDPDRALELLDRALEVARASGAHFVLGVAGLTRVGLLARRGEAAEAIPGILGLIEHWREGGAWTQQWITMRTVVELLVQSGDHDGAAVLQGALDATEWSSEVFGPDAERMEKARAAVVAALGDKAATTRAKGARFNDLESVQYAVARLELLLE